MDIESTHPSLTDSPTTEDVLDAVKEEGLYACHSTSGCRRYLFYEDGAFRRFTFSDRDCRVRKDDTVCRERAHRCLEMWDDVTVIDDEKPF